MEVKKELDFMGLVVKEETFEDGASTSQSCQDAESETFELDYLLNAQKRRVAEANRKNDETCIEETINTVVEHEEEIIPMVPDGFDEDPSQMEDSASVEQHFRDKIRQLREELSDYYGDFPNRINNTLFSSERVRFEEAMSRGNVFVMPGRLRVTKYPFNLLSSRPMKCAWVDTDGTVRGVEMSGNRGDVRLRFLDETHVMPEISEQSLADVVKRRKFKDDATANALLIQHYANSKSKRPNFPNVVQQMCQSAKYVEQPVVVVADPNTVISSATLQSRPSEQHVKRAQVSTDTGAQKSVKTRFVPYRYVSKQDLITGEEKTLGDLVNGIRKINPNINVHQFLLNRLNKIKGNEKTGVVEGEPTSSSKP